eukprot:3828416-Pyramimonas_sp.AAC.1
MFAVSNFGILLPLHPCPLVPVLYHEFLVVLPMRLCEVRVNVLQERVSHPSYVAVCHSALCRTVRGQNMTSKAMP